ARRVPSAPLAHDPRPYVPSRAGGRLARQRPAAVHVDTLAEWMIDARLPVVGERAVLPEDPLGERLRERRPVDLELVLLADALVPATEEEARVVDVVIEVMVREEHVVHPRRHDPHLDQLVRRGGTGIRPHVLAAGP